MNASRMSFTFSCSPGPNSLLKPAPISVTPMPTRPPIASPHCAAAFFDIVATIAFVISFPIIWPICAPIAAPRLPPPSSVR